MSYSMVFAKNQSTFLAVFAVAPRTGAWIEIHFEVYKLNPAAVAPRTGGVD